MAAFIWLASLYGFYKIASKSYRLMNFFYRHYLRRTKDLYARYASKESYAVVTGGSDGIGLEICQ